MSKCSLGKNDSEDPYPSDTKVTATFTVDSAGLEKGLALGSSPTFLIIFGSSEGDEDGEGKNDGLDRELHGD